MSSEIAEKSDDVVLSGIAGRFPNSRTMREFAENLYGKVDMIDDRETRWKNIYEEIPRRFGKISDLDKFDTAFFSMLANQSRFTDPQLRMLLEHTYEAILDAGVSPQSLRGTRTAVVVAYSTTDAKDNFNRQLATGPFGLILSGNTAFLLANRISYVLGFCGPSLALDTACSGSGYALDYAFHAMRAGLCENAIVAGSQLDLCTNPFLEYHSFQIMSHDGISRPFDSEASGFVRGEAVSVAFLQRRKNAKRIYAQIVHSLTNNDGFKKEGPTLPSTELQQQLMEQVYADVGLDPAHVDFFEAHATGTKLGDPREVASIDRVFCKNPRKNILTIGSIKSNMGHAEAAAGMASLAKVLLAMETGKFPPNINVKKLREDVPAFAEGRILVATEAVELTESPFIAMNSFGIGGSNAHILFKRHSKAKKMIELKSDEERMVLWSGRTAEAVNAIFEDIASRPMDVEHIALLQSSQVLTPDANTYRGFAVFRNSEGNAICTAQSTQSFDGVRRPVVFVYAGLGTQWHRMGQSLMEIPIFAESIRKSHDFMLSKDLNLLEILRSSDENVYENFVNALVAIMAIEIALTDVLFGVGIKPDFIIGHSLGEVGCSYADGCCTREEALISIYWRAKCTIDSEMSGGAMSAVGMSRSELQKRLPHDIDIACYNSTELCTISGPRRSIEQFVDSLREEKFFAKEVASVGYAFHSRYIQIIGKDIEQRISAEVKSSHRRSKKWLTTAFPQECAASEFFNAKYQATNFSNSVYFEHAAKRLPLDGLMIEIAPHCFFKTLLKSAQNKCEYVGLTHKYQGDGRGYFLSALGKIFQLGVDFDIAKLYPAVDFPVSRGTPMISPVVKWNHSVSHFVPLHDHMAAHSRVKQFINFNSKELQFLKHQVIDGKVIVPASFWILLVWKNFAQMHSTRYEKMRVTIADFECLRATFIPASGELVLAINIDIATGQFSFYEGSALIVRGTIVCDEEQRVKKAEVTNCENRVVLTAKDFYKHAKVLGFQHLEKFQMIREIADDGSSGKVEWTNDWVVFIECVLQSVILTRKFSKLELTAGIKRISIDPFLHAEILEESGSFLPLESAAELDVTRCGGFEFFGTQCTPINRRSDANILLEYSKFVPYFSSREPLTTDDAIKCIFESYFKGFPQSLNFKLVEVNEDGSECLLRHFSKLDQCFTFTFDVTILGQPQSAANEFSVVDRDISTFSGINVILSKNCIKNENFIEKISSVLTPEGVLITKERPDVENFKDNLEVLSRYLLIDGDVMYLVKLKKQEENSSSIKGAATEVVEITPNVDTWLENLKRLLKNPSINSIILFAHNSDPQNLSGLLGLFNCLRLEHREVNFRCVLISDKNSPKFDINHEFYSSQLAKGFALNVCSDGRWGCYQHLEMKEEEEEKPRDGHFYVNYTTRGNLASLKWRRGHIKDVDPSTCKEDLIRVHYSVLNFRDVVYAYGYLPDETTFTQDCRIGLEFAGVRVKTGERVAGIALKCGAIATYVDGANTVLFDVDDNWSLEDAATVFVMYLTVYYSLFCVASIKRGQSILIHAGDGGVGQAALHVAFTYGLEVFTTVSSAERREFLVKNYPQLKVENIGSSNDDSFYDMVMARTGGRGVDYVINSLLEGRMVTSLDCVAKYGYFLEVGQADIKKGTKISLKHLERFVTMKWVKIDKVDLDTDEARAAIERLKCDLKAGIVKPLLRTVFDACDFTKAFQYMSARSHIGKVLIKVRENDGDVLSLPFAAAPRFNCDPESCYVIVGGLGGIGLEFSQWLVSRKCRKLLLSSRRGISNSYQAFKIRYWQSFGVETIVSTADVTTKEGCEALIKEAMNLGPIAGVFNFAVVASSSLLVDQSSQDFERTLAPKAVATQNLHEATIKLCPKLEHFVVYSSYFAGRGTSCGHTAYATANSAMERIIEKRHALNLPAKAIQLGAISGVGILAEKQQDQLEFGIAAPQSIGSLLEQHDRLLLHPEPIVACTATATKKGVDGEKRNLIDMLMRLLNIKDRKGISLNSTFSQLGIDSLAGVELHQTIEREYGIAVSSSEIRSLTISQLEAKVGAQQNEKKSVSDRSNENGINCFEMIN